jgi:hypothetical protein
MMAADTVSVSEETLRRAARANGRDSAFPFQPVEAW